MHVCKLVYDYVCTRAASNARCTLSTLGFRPLEASHHRRSQAPGLTCSKEAEKKKAVMINYTDNVHEGNNSKIGRSRRKLF